MAYFNSQHSEEVDTGPVPYLVRSHTIIIGTGAIYGIYVVPGAHETTEGRQGTSNLACFLY